MDHDNSKNADFQTREHGGVNIEVEGNDTMEEEHDDEDHDDKNDHNDQDDHDDQDDDDDDVDAELDVPILEKAHEPYSACPSSHFCYHCRTLSWCIFY